MDSNQDIFIRVEGRAGRITLTRPKALNAITQAIVDAMFAALQRWELDPDFALVLVDAEGGKAFSAGGDLTSIYNAARAGDIASANSFWRDEYRLNAYIARYPKPYVAVMDGIVMGGGVGISAHGSHRIVTDASLVAMPECAVGLITDAGGSYLLGRSPGHIGAYLGLTGTRMKGEDAIYAGFADIFICRARLEEAKAALVATGDVSVLSRFAAASPPSALAGDRQIIDRCFAAETVPAIMELLRTDGSEWALKTLGAIEMGSPLSAVMILSAVRDARSLQHALRNEYRFVSRVLEYGDFVEGIRAMVIDKDRSPKWRHAHCGAVPAGLIATMRSEAEGGDPDFLEEEQCR